MAINGLGIVKALAAPALDRLSSLPGAKLLGSLPGVKLAQSLVEKLPAREILGWMNGQSPVAFSATGPAANRNQQVLGPRAPSPQELAQLSDHVYSNGANPPAGFRVATAAERQSLGIRDDMLSSPNSSYRARVYVRDQGGAPQYVVAFQGTTSGSDWKANFRQGAGLSSDHYSRALAIGRELALRPNANVTITGHSLGGGLASAAAVASGKDAATFNAAGLSDNTIQAANAIRRDAGITNDPRVAAYYVRGEILSAIQDGGDRVLGALLGGLPAAALADAPEAYGTRIALDAVRPEGKRWWQDNTFNRHGMDWIHSSLGR